MGCRKMKSLKVKDSTGRLTNSRAIPFRPREKLDTLTELVDWALDDDRNKSFPCGFPAPSSIGSSAAAIPSAF